MSTPEAKVKDRVKKLLKEHSTYWFMPVQHGLGAAGLDFHCCLNSIAFFIETKAGNKGPTPRQALTMYNISQAGGFCFLVNEEQETVEELKRFLTLAKQDGIRVSDLRFAFDGVLRRWN